MVRQRCVYSQLSSLHVHWRLNKNILRPDGRQDMRLSLQFPFIHLYDTDSDIDIEASLTSCCILGRLLLSNKTKSSLIMFLPGAHCWYMKSIRVDAWSCWQLPAASVKLPTSIRLQSWIIDDHEALRIQRIVYKCFLLCLLLRCSSCSFHTNTITCCQSLRLSCSQPQL